MDYSQFKNIPGIDHSLAQSLFEPVLANWIRQHINHGGIQARDEAGTATPDQKVVGGIDTTHYTHATAKQGLPQAGINGPRGL